MPPWRSLARGIRALLRRHEAERDVADEVRHFLEEAEADLVARGATLEEARRTVRLRYGDGLAAREEVRSHAWESGLESLVYDLRLAARRLRRSRGFTGVAVLTLALGIGAATAVVSAAGAVLFRPLPYPDPDRILSVAPRGQDGDRLHVAFGTFLELSARAAAFEALAVFRPWQPTLTGAPEAERLDAQMVSAAYFDVLRVAPALGPGWEAAADHPSASAAVILADGLWRRRFGADPGLVGRQVQLDGRPHTVVGVMPPGFENVTGPGAEAWTLLRYDPAPASFDTREWGNHLVAAGRVRRGIGSEDARRELEALAANPVAEFPRPRWASLEHGFQVEPLGEAATAAARPAMRVLLGAAGLLLAVTCANVTLLLLARGARRRGELAMREALGASRGRLARSLLTETFLLAALGGVLGVLVARVGLSALLALAPPSVPRLEAVGLDAWTLAFAAGLTFLVGLLVGVVPVLGQRGAGTLGGAGRGTTGRGGRGRDALVVAEVAFAAVLLVGAGLLLRTTQHLFSTPPGFEPPGRAVMQIHTSGLGGGDEGVHAFFDEALAAARGVPGVEAAALASQLPLGGEAEEFGVMLEGVEGVEGVNGPAYRYAVTPGYFEAMGIALLRGRVLEREDVAGAPPVAVVSESLARRLAGAGDPIGLRVRVGGPGDRPPFTIVGVVADVKQVTLEADRGEAVYVTPHQWHWADAVRWLVVRGGADVRALVPALRGAVRSVDANQPVVRAGTLEDLVERSEARRRFVLLVLGAFALSALTLAGVGLYGVLAGSVAQRTREIGVRVALGASGGEILATVARRGVALAALGLCLGLLGAAAAGRVLATLLYGVSRLDPATYLAVAALLAAVAALACWVPAVRAARVDPATVLAAE